MSGVHFGRKAVSARKRTQQSTRLDESEDHAAEPIQPSRKTIRRRYLMTIASTFTRTTTAQKMIRKGQRLR